MPYEFALVTGAVTAWLTVPAEVAPHTLARLADEITRLLPGGWRTHPEPPASPQVHIIVGTGPPGVDVVGSTVRVWLSPDEVATARLAYVTYTLCERARQQRGIVTVHANAVAIPDGTGAVLVLGDKGAGKTSTCLALAQRGYHLLGDDLALLALDGRAGLRLVAGKRVARVRDPALGYEAKRTVALPPPPDAPTQVVAAVRVSVHPWVSTPRLAAGTPLSVVDRLRLHENLARYVSGLPTPLSLEPAVAGPIYPLDTPQCAATRARMIQRIPLTYLHAPNAEHAADLVEEMIQP